MWILGHISKSRFCVGEQDGFTDLLYSNLPHSAALEEIDDLEDWVRKCLGDTTVDKL
jgi:hypothetical protein